MAKLKVSRSKEKTGNYRSKVDMKLLRLVYKAFEV